MAPLHDGWLQPVRSLLCLLCSPTRRASIFSNAQNHLPRGLPIPCWWAGEGSHLLNVITTPHLRRETPNLHPPRRPLPRRSSRVQEGEQTEKTSLGCARMRPRVQRSLR